MEMFETVIIIALLGFIFFAFFKKPKKNNYKGIGEVKSGDRIKVNLSGFVVNAICLNNTPSENKMFIRFMFKSGNTSESVEKYSSFTFENFNTLNKVENNKTEKERLKEKLLFAVEDQRYEDAAKLRDELAKLDSKQKIYQ